MITASRTAERKAGRIILGEPEKKKPTGDNRELVHREKCSNVPLQSMFCGTYNIPKNGQGGV